VHRRRLWGHSWWRLARSDSLLFVCVWRSRGPRVGWLPNYEWPTSFCVCDHRRALIRTQWRKRVAAVYLAKLLFHEDMSCYSIHRLCSSYRSVKMMFRRLQFVGPSPFVQRQCDMLLFGIPWYGGRQCRRRRCFLFIVVIVRRRMTGMHVFALD
jgi:hypothetical protein